MANEVIKEWTEMSQAYLSDAPPKAQRYEAYLFLNRCKFTQHGGGKQILARKSDVITLEADTQADLDRQILAFSEQENVRLLAEGIESNQLPKRVINAPLEVVFGEADIYYSPSQGDGGGSAAEAGKQSGASEFGN